MQCNLTCTSLTSSSLLPVYVYAPYVLVSGLFSRAGVSCLSALSKTAAVQSSSVAIIVKQPMTSSEWSRRDAFRLASDTVSMMTEIVNDVPTQRAASHARVSQRHHYSLRNIWKLTVRKSRRASLYRPNHHRAQEHESEAKQSCVLSIPRSSHVSSAKACLTQLDVCQRRRRQHAVEDSRLGARMRCFPRHYIWHRRFSL